MPLHVADRQSQAGSHKEREGTGEEILKNRRPFFQAHRGSADGGHLRQCAGPLASGIGGRLAGGQGHDLIDLVRCNEAGRPERGASFSILRSRDLGTAVARDRPFDG